MSGRFSNTSAKPALAGEGAELGAGVGDDREAAAAAGALPRPLEVAARLDGGAGLRRGDVQRRGRVALEAEPRDGGGVGGVEHVEPRPARAPARSVRASTSGKRLEPPMPITRTCSIPSTSASHRLVSAGQVGLHLGDHRDPPEPVGQLGGVVAPERVVAGEEPRAPRRGRAGRCRTSRTASSKSLTIRPCTSSGRAHPAVIGRRPRGVGGRRDLVDHRVGVGEAGEHAPRRRRGRGRRRGRAWRGRRRRSARCRCAGRSA